MEAALRVGGRLLLAGIQRTVVVYVDKHGSAGNQIVVHQARSNRELAAGCVARVASAVHQRHRQCVGSIGQRVADVGIDRRVGAGVGYIVRRERIGGGCHRFACRVLDQNGEHITSSQSRRQTYLQGHAVARTVRIVL